MNPKVPERNKKAGVSYAVTDDGIELPVIDVTHPAFALHPSPGELAAMRTEILTQLEKGARMPAALRWVLFRVMALGSRLIRAIQASSGTFQDGTSTYLMKLGAENLGAGYASKLDRRIAASAAVVTLRLRLQDTARLLAEGLAPALAARPGAPLRLLNIAGGPAADSLNALLLLHKAHPSSLEGREIQIQVLDLDTAGPSFARRALEALQAKGAPLHGLAATLRHVPYDWKETAALRAALDGAADAVCAASSEGGLFDYGSDSEIAANLHVLRDRLPPGSPMAGSFTPDDTQELRIRSGNRVATVARHPDAFAALVRRSGWTVETRIEGPLNHVVGLRSLES